ncbi:MAG: LysR family transcriptional regulator [Pseudomonadota bacterium]
MSDRNLKKLPLLDTFNAIMMRGSLVSAAEAMNITQSAVSKQLAQLREWLDDELFVRTSDGMQPTPKALALRERVEEIVAQAADLAAEGRVSPVEFTGEFVLSATDEVLERIVPTLVDRLADEAPNLRLVALPLAQDYSAQHLESGRVNMLVAVNWHAPEQLVQKKLATDPFACVMHKDHVLADGNLTLKRYAAATHILVAPLGYKLGVVDVELQQRGMQRRVCASVPVFGMVNEELLGTNRICTLPSRVVDRLVDTGPFIKKQVPIALPVSDYFALWHPRFSAEPRLRWMLGAVEEAFHD